jgi:hypothetical protein
MTRDDIIRMAREAGYCHAEASDLDFKRLSRFAVLVATTEREECASIEVTVTTPERDYDELSPKETYEEALIDCSLAFRAAIRARGRHD